MGIDLIEIERIRKALKKWGYNLERHILTPEEIELAKNKKEIITFLAGRFAAKEAIFKSLGVNPRWQEVLILPQGKGKPVVNLSGNLLNQVNKKGISKVLVSISHSKDYAIAQAIALE